MKKVYKLSLIHEFECELIRSVKAGKIYQYVNMHERTPLQPTVYGVEIMLHDQTTATQLQELKNYIEWKYKFKVDIESLTDTDSKIKIILVEY